VIIVERKYLEKFNDLYCESLDISDINNGYFSNNYDSLAELSSWFKQLMTKYKIGTKIDRRYWGDKKRKEILDVIYDTLKNEDNQLRPVSSLELFDEISKDVRSKNHTKSDFVRIAKTEAASCKSLFQLFKYKEAGIQQVRHITKNDSRVSNECKMLNNRVFDIDALLNERTQQQRIPVHPYCRCRYAPYFQQTKRSEALNLPKAKPQDPEKIKQLSRYSKYYHATNRAMKVGDEVPIHSFVTAHLSYAKFLNKQYIYEVEKPTQFSHSVLLGNTLVPESCHIILDKPVKVIKVL
jgi:SPP1 gp7 family putative phage head morphogenesis protein